MNDIFVSDEVEKYYKKLINRFNSTDFANNLILLVKIDEFNNWQNKYIAYNVSKLFNESYGNSFEANMHEYYEYNNEHTIYIKIHKKHNKSFLTKFYELFRCA